MTLTEEELRMVRHAIGYDAPRGKQGYRNRYCVGTDTSADIVWRGLVERGLATRSSRSPAASDSLYFVTVEGARAAGLGEAAIVRACGTEEEQRKQRAKYEKDSARKRKPETNEDEEEDEE